MILKHRDRELLRFEWNGLEGVRVCSVNKRETRFLPLEMKGKATDEALWQFIAHRVVPRGRRYIRETLAKLGLSSRNIPRTVEFSHALSLNDVYWMVPDDFSGTWAECNLYANEFDAGIAALALTGLGLSSAGKRRTSPEFTTNGMLKKCWRRVRGRVLLCKGGTEHAVNAGFEPYSEFYAAQVAETMGLRHVAYDLAVVRKTLCSTCPLFTSDRYSYVPAGRLVELDAALKDERFADIFFFDAVIFNTDRHLGNFGYLVDNDTNEIVGAAPIFDNGYGLFSLATDRPDAPDYHEFGDLSKFFCRGVVPALYDRWLGFPHAITAERMERLRRLEGFRFRRHKRYNLPSHRLGAIEDFIQKRVSDILQYGEKADDLLKISSCRGIIKDKKIDARGTISNSLAIQVLQNLAADPFITAKELSAILQVSHRTIMRQLKVLQGEGRIRRVGARKNGSWKVLVKF